MSRDIVVAILEQANENGVSISLNGDSLKLKFDKDRSPNPGFITFLKHNKAELVEFLSNDVNISFFKEQSLISADSTIYKRIPLSFSQERLWFIDRLQGSVNYHIPTILRMEGSIDKDSLFYAIRDLSIRHEVLRTIFVEEEGVAYQELLPEDSVKLLFVEDVDQSGLNDFIEGEVSRPFDLSGEPMLRSYLIKISEDVHVFLLVIHHIATDGWSQSILMEDLLELYQSRRDSRFSSLKPLLVQYKDYALWQREYLSGEVLEKKLSYWESKLRGVSPLHLPTDYIRPAIQSMRGSFVNLELSPALTVHLQLLCKTEGVTLFMLLLTVFKVLLYRYSGQDDICVGSPSANRTQKEIEPLVGFFVNTLVLRSDLSNNPVFRDLLSQVKTTTLGAYTHQDVPFEKIVERVEKTRDMSRSPLFQVMFSFLDSEPQDQISLQDNITVGSVPMRGIQSKFDLSLDIAFRGMALSMSMVYCTDLLGHMRVQRMMNHFKGLLQAVVDSPSTKIGALKMLDRTEEQRILEEFNSTDVPVNTEKNILELFEEQAKHLPNSTAVIFEGKQLNYYELNGRAEALALILQERGIRKGHFVPIVMSRGIDYMVGVIAVLKTGAACVPLSIYWPLARLFSITEELNATIVLSNNKGASVSGIIEDERVLLVDHTLLKSVNANFLTCKVTLDSPIFLYYTSGSTGLPKGVIIPHKGILNRFLWMNDYFGAESAACVLRTTKHIFDSAIWQLFWPLINGGKTVIPSEQVFDLAYFTGMVQEFKITMTDFVPALFNELVNDMKKDGISPDLNCLRDIVIGGEAITVSAVNDFRKQYAGIRLTNLYGPTEASIGCIYFPIIEHNYTSIPIGKPIWNTKIFILDRHNNPQPIGIEGELNICGVGLADGYFSNVKQTEKSFVPNTVTNGKNNFNRLYRTGDIGRWLSDGTIEYLGRIDEQVKIRGYRIEPGEVEVVLQSHPGVRQCVVVVRGDSSNKRLVGYIVSTGLFDKDDVQEYLRSRLPEYMVPSVLVALDEFPLTSNGKVDKKRLPDPQDLLSTGYSPAQTETEAILVGIWSTLLNIDRDKIGIHDNFFELGGHSLLVVRVSSSIRKELATEVSIQDIFLKPTIQFLSRHIDQQGQGLMFPAISARYSKKIPLSFSQERLWFIDRLQGSVNYHIPTILRMEGSIDKDSLFYAIRDLSIRHEVLRTIFVEEEGVAYQELLPEDSVKLLFVEDVDQSGLNDFIEGEVSRPFDLSGEPMLRSYLIKISEDAHVFLLVIHHIATDGWSQSILMEDLLELYQSRRDSRFSSLKPLLVQYKDYALWQREYLSGEVLEKKLSYWESKLRGVSPLHLPTDYIRPAIQSMRGSFVNLELSPALTVHLQLLCKTEGVTLFMLLLTVFKVLLYRYSGQDDICVGSPSANRTQKEIEPLVGFFVNTLVLRSDLSNNPVFRDLLSQVKTTTLGAYTYQDVPFEKIVERVEKTRDMSRSPLFQVMFDLQDLPSSSTAGSTMDINLSSISLSHTTTKFDLIFSVGTGLQGLVLGVEYRVDLFSKATIQQMMFHYEQLLGSITGDMTSRIMDLPMLLAEEEEQLLIDFNNTSSFYPREKTIVDLFEEQVLRSPDAVAVGFEGSVMSYAELNVRSNQLAHYLMSQGVGKESLVGLCLNRSFELIIGVLGVLKSGGAYVPIDPEYPKERIGYMLGDSQVGYVITHEAYAELVADFDSDAILLLDSGKNILAGEQRSNPQTGVTPNQLAYVIYTSGSSGRPKGVMVEHRSVVNLITYQTCRFNVGADEKILSFSNYCFDASVEQFWICLFNGGQLIFLSKAILSNNERFSSLLLLEKITHFHATPSFLNTVITDKDYYFRRVIAGGEPCPEHLAHTWARRYVFFNEYGPTETTVTSIEFEFLSQEAKQIIPIGKPISNTCIYILDSAMHLLPLNSVGELWISGEGLSRGYLNNPELTALKFIAHPFGASGEKLYRTGDIGRWLSDGTIEYLGRIDEQVKIRGYRIEPGEVEVVLQSHPGVRQCVVVVRGDSSNKRLVGYIVSTGLFDKDDVQEYLRSRLPEYMVPSVLVALDEFPLTSNGKVDKKRLPDPQDLLSTGYSPAQTETEAILVGIWSTLLNIDRDKIGIHDNFFELGGHSLLVVRVSSSIRKELATEVSIQDIFLKPTIQFLSRHIDQQGQGLMFPAISARYSKKIPLSFSQERLWFIDRLQGSVNYHIPTILRMEGSIDKDSLFYAIRDLSIRHEVLRTIFVEEEGVAYQELLPEDSVKLLFVEDVDQSGLNDFIEGEVSRPFDLSGEPMLRSYLIKISEDAHVFLLVIHHIATDGWSQSILMEDLLELYQSRRDSRFSSLKPLLVQYKDYALWQREYLSGEVLEKKLSYWESKLRGVSPLHLPTDYIRPAIQSMRGSFVNLELSPALTVHLQLLCKTEGVTLFMLLLTVFKVLLYRYSGQDDICVGSPSANRTQKEIEPLVGFFVNTLVLRSDLSNNPVFRDLLSQVKTTTLGAYTYQDVPFEKIVERVEKTRDMSRSPLFQVMFDLQDLPSSSTAGSTMDINLSSISLSHTTTKFDLIFSVGTGLQGLVLGVEYRVDLFSKATIQQMMFHYEQLLGSITGDMTSRIMDLPMLLAEEEEQLLIDFNNTSSFYPREKTIVDLFEEQVLRSPDAVAVGFEGSVMSYAELNVRSNQLAHYLMSQGVGKESLVGLCLNRSFELIIGVLGVLKSGGAYVPIDPEYPKERIGYMLGDSQVGYVITHEAYAELVADFDSDAILLLDSGKNILAGEQRSNPQTGVTPNQLAYVIYTSGSSGRPKGVMVEHRSVVNLITYQTCRFNVGADEKILSFSNYCFDASVEQFWICLFNGGQLIFLSKAILSNNERFSSLLLLEKITHFHATPSFLNTVITDKDYYFRRVIAGGEPCPEHLAHTWARRYVFFNEYGPTETTVTSIEFEFLSQEAKQIIPIGKPISNTCIYILDSAMHLLPLNSVGELWISGEGLSRGYLNNPELTALKFIAHPFGASGEKLYRTGDIGRWLSDGTIEYLGRIDEQVKIRGYRIEPGEVEVVLQSHPGVRQCVVVVRGDSSNKRLVGYIVSTGLFDKDDVQEYLRSRLPEYMVPSVLVALDEFPLTSNGKVDKKRLPDPQDLLSTGYSPAQTETEAILVGIWSTLLNIDRDKIGIHDNFFELGGHSLLVVRVVSMINQTINRKKVSVSVSDIYNLPTIYRISQRLSQQKTYASGIIDFGGENEKLTKLYFIPPVIGSSTIFKSLASQLDSHYSCYGMMMKGFDLDVPFDESVEEMATRFVNNIIAMNGQTIVNLVGYSMGATVAFEMSKQFFDRGVKTRVVFIDRPPIISSSHEVNAKELEKEFDNHLLLYPAEAFSAEATHKMKQIFIHNNIILSRYMVRGRIPADMMLVEATLNRASSLVKTWETFTTGNVQHVCLQSTHYTIIENEKLPELIIDFLH